MTTEEHIESLRAYFNSIHKQLPNTIQLTKQETITNVRMFIVSHLRYAKGVTGDNVYLNRLERLKTILNEKGGNNPS